MCCLSIIVVYIVLCSEIHTAAPERSRLFNDRRTKKSQVKIHPWSSACFGFHQFFTIVDGQTLLSTFLIMSQSPTSSKREEWLCKGNWLILRCQSLRELLFPFAHTTSSRCRRKPLQLLLPQARTTRYRESFFYRSALLWNSLPQDIQAHTNSTAFR